MTLHAYSECWGRCHKLMCRSLIWFEVVVGPVDGDCYKQTASVLPPSSRTSDKPACSSVITPLNHAHLLRHPRDYLRNEG